MTFDFPVVLFKVTRNFAFVKEILKRNHLSLKHAERNEICLTIVSGIVTEEAPVSFWPFSPCPW